MKRRMLSLLLCVVMTLSMLTVCIFPASAVTNPYPTIQYVGGVATLPCTYYAWQQAYDRLGIALPGWDGNAIDWYNKAANAGYSVGGTPRANSIAVWSMEPMHSLGHVAFVTAVNGSNMTINESGRIDLPETNGIVNGQVVSSVVGTTCFEGRYLIGFIYLEKLENYTYTQLSEGNYYIQNAQTGGFIIYENAVDANEQNVVLTPFNHNNAQKMHITAASTGYKIQPNGTARILNPFGTNVVSGLNVNIYDNKSNSSQWWRFQKVNGGYVIHNVQNENCVLDATEYGNVVLSNYQKGKQSQIWKIEKTSVLPEVPTYSCSVENQRIVVDFTNYKSSEMHEVVIQADSGEKVYAAYNIEGQRHTTTKLSPGTYSLRVVAVSKYIGAYRVGANSTVQVEPSFEYATISVGNYYIQNTQTGGFIIYENAVDANKQNVVLTPFGHHNAQKMYITRTSTGYKIQPNGTVRLLNPDGTTVANGLNVNIYDNRDDSAQWWQFEKVDDGYVIHNVKNEDYVLDATEYGNVVLSNYQKGKQSQIWKIEKTSVLPEVPTYSCSVENQRIVVDFTNYKSSEVHEVVIYADSGEKVYAAYNIEGQQHTTTKLSPGTYSLRVVAVSKYIGVYQVGINSHVQIYATCDHIFGTIVVDKSATCGTTGLGHKKCTKCGIVVQSGIVIPATSNHSWNSGVVTKQPTTTTIGIKTFTCDVCGQTKTETIPVTAPSQKPANNNPFTDVKSGDYYKDAVAWAVENGVTTGTSKTTFGPNESCTRVQAVTFLWRAAGCPSVKNAEGPFTDVNKSDYYYKAVLWAAERGVTSGTTKTTFAPNETCTRGQIVTFMWRALSGKKVTAKNPFIDVKKSDYYFDAVLWAVKTGATTGTTPTTFGPSENCTRGQIVTFLYRAMV